MMTYRLYFGRRIDKNTRDVSDSSLQNFFSEVVTPLFPGFTVYETSGYWNGASEDSVVVEIISNDRNREARDKAAVQVIAKEYKTRFSQESVLITETKGEMYFV